ncbi:ABC exporter membrane fusion protein [Anabaena sp. FACHB-1237]|uniref:ABC exporter membrane fusion protein n=1 Tax=Anabaena sp. FACHB-1237 TaxID=2692769 RepID=UPI0016818F66|nr:ABC exporter membrane fusion protein [Anabaena sp. FACHB-1237]MBD2136383.1 ABC exporter membrane fusion protein [Anabaena sp. FACHB-1237]
MVHKYKQLLDKPVSLWTIILAGTGVLLSSILSVSSISRFCNKFKIPVQLTSNKVNNPTNKVSTPQINTVTALGRLEPQGEVIRLSAPNLQAGVRIDKLFVKKGDIVSQGQLIAILDNYNSHLAALEKAQRQVKVAQASLKQVEAGAKSGDISAQKATIARLKAELRGEISTQKATINRLEFELNNAEIENKRYQKLYQDGAIAASDADTKKLRRDTVKQQLNEANSRLNSTIETLQKQLTEAEYRLTSIQEIRPTDIQLAQANLESAKASVKQAQAELNLSAIDSPIKGQILKIHAWPGEIISNNGILELGQTQQMLVVAEVYETDIKKVRLGQSVIITSDAFMGKLKGTVIDIGLQVGKQNIFTNNPSADTDNKIVDVKIRIDKPQDNQRVSNLTNLQVQAFIQIL